MFVSTLRLSANRSVSRRACGSHHSAPFTHPDLDNSCEKGAVARSPFDVQFISASTTDPVRRSSVGLRVVCVPLPSSCFELREALRFQHSIVDPSTSTKLTCRLSMLEKIISHRSRPMLFPVASPPRRTGVQPAA